jgi:NAD(P)H-hydrate epimerase
MSLNIMSVIDESQALYRADQVRELDRRAIDEQGIPGATLMQRAGQASFDALRQAWPGANDILVLAGVGNNAGDGFVIARLAHSAGLGARAMLLADPERLRGDALGAYRAMTAAGVHAEAYHEDGLQWADVIVDAMLGTGLGGEVREPFAAVIHAVNQSGRPVLAVDIPSGLSADTGQALGVAVRATMTVSFIGLKQGPYLAAGPEYCGELCFDDLDVPAIVYQNMAPAMSRMSLDAERQALQPRRRSAHKGDFGHLLVVGGMPGFSGAPRMTGEAALRCGAGLVSIATHPDHAAMLNAQRPELMCHPVRSRSDLDALLARATVVVLGPGLGRSTWSEALWDRVLDVDCPLLVDADGLNLLAAQPQRREGWVLTPHPGEAARLLGLSTTEVEADRPAAVAALQARYGGTVLLKGAGTLVQSGEGPPKLCPLGNPGMAGGGMGDVLSGVIGALLAQGLAAAAATSLGVCLHAAAADRAAAGEGERGLLASDLMPHLRRLVN